MKLLIMDESANRTEQLSEVLKQKNFDVESCVISGDFMEQIESNMPDMLLLDVDTWQRGYSIYKYFDFLKKIDDLSILFYNAPENFVTISGRQKNDKDRVVKKPYDIDSIINMLEQV